MLDIVGAVYARLTTDATLMGSLKAYGAGKALVADPPPGDLLADSDKPLIIISAPADDEDADSYSEAYRNVTIRIRLYHRPSGSTLPLDTAAERVRARLKSWPGSNLTGGKLINAAVSGPVAGPTDDPAVEGRIVTARLLLEETS
jgi:hypothetical protein